MESLEALNERISKLVDKLDVSVLDSHLTRVGEGQIKEVYDQSGRPNGYYKWLYCYVKNEKPKQIVELGAAAGISTLVMAAASDIPEIYSVDCDPHAWRWMNQEYPNVFTVQGDDLDLSIYPEMDLLDTDFWFFDSLHTKKQLESEIEVYSDFFKRGAILAFDDIHINEGMNEVWENLPFDKLDLSDKLHYTGWGIART